MRKNLTPEEAEEYRRIRIEKKRLYQSVAPRCVYCHRILRLKAGSMSFRSVRVTFDHIIPVSRGGTNDPANLVPCCKACNEVKGDRTPAEWARAILKVKPRPTLSQRLRACAMSLASVLPFLAAKGGAT